MFQATINQGEIPRVRGQQYKAGQKKGVELSPRQLDMYTL